MKKGSITNLNDYKDKVNFETFVTVNSFNNILKSIFSNNSDYENYALAMDSIGEYDYSIGFNYNQTNLRLRLNFVLNIRGTTIVIRPLLTNVPSYKVLTSLEWTYAHPTEFLDSDIIRQLEKMNHVGQFLLANFKKSK